MATSAEGPGPVAVQKRWGRPQGTVNPLEAVDGVLSEADGGTISAAEAIEHNPCTCVACVEHLGPAVAVIGYCWGGTLAWVAAQRLDIRASVGYYGGGITGHLDADLYCPVMLHFGGEDTAITPGDILTILKAYPQAKIHSYPGAGHGFNREPDADYTGLALERTLDFLGK